MEWDSQADLIFLLFSYVSKKKKKKVAHKNMRVSEENANRIQGNFIEW